MSILLYGRSSPPCNHCKRAVEVLDSRGVDYEYIDLSLNPELLELFRMHHKTIPQIYENGKHIGGSEAAELVASPVVAYGNPEDWEWINDTQT